MLSVRWDLKVTVGWDYITGRVLIRLAWKRLKKSKTISSINSSMSKSPAVMFTPLKAPTRFCLSFLLLYFINFWLFIHNIAAEFLNKVNLFQTSEFQFRRTPSSNWSDIIELSQWRHFYKGYCRRLVPPADINARCGFHPGGFQLRRSFWSSECLRRMQRAHTPVQGKSWNIQRFYDTKSVLSGTTIICFLTVRIAWNETFHVERIFL